MSLRKLAGGGAACAYCGFALVMEGQRQCCPAGRDYDALLRERDEAVALLRTAVANCDLTGYEGAAAWADRRDAFLAKLEAKP